MKHNISDTEISVVGIDLGKSTFHVHGVFQTIAWMEKMMATKAESSIPENLIRAWVDKTVRIMRTGVRGFPSGPEAQPQQQAGYMCATFPLLPTQFILAQRSGPYML